LKTHPNIKLMLDFTKKKKKTQFYCFANIEKK
jgi:hypothetical protein